jgi:hypothetical protein
VSPVPACAVRPPAARANAASAAAPAARAVAAGDQRGGGP